MLGLLVLLFVAADFASLYFAWAWLRPEYGGWLAFGLVALYLFLAGIVGGWVIRAGGFLAGMNAIRAARRGESPTRDLLNGLLAFAAGLLIMFPGLLSDAVALLLLVPPTRWLARRILFGRLERRAATVGARPAGSEAGSVDVDYRIE